MLISQARWQRDYGSRPDVLGRTLTLDGTAYTIIGVMPARWDVLGSAGVADAEQLWIPLSLTPGNDTTRMVGAQTVARLRTGVTAEQAQREVKAIFSRLPSVKTMGDFALTARVMRPQQMMLRDSRRTALLVMMAAVGVVLLVACANVANLLLARGAARAREVALRAALGASRWRMVRHVAAESVLLSLVGGAMGVLVAWVGLHLLLALRPESLRALAGVRVNLLVLEFTLGLSLATGLLSGLMPALRTTAPKQGQLLRQGTSGVVRADGGRRLRAALVASEVALSVILLVSAGLLVRSVMQLQRVDVGFDPQNLFTVEMSLPRGAYAQPASRELFAARMLAAIRRVPGVSAATQADEGPTSYGYEFAVPHIAGRTSDDGSAHVPIASNRVRPGYFRTVGIRLLRGRTFTAGEMRTGSGVIVSQAMARRFWPHELALGRQIWFGSDSAHAATVVGVVADVAANGLTDVEMPEMYSPYHETGVPVIRARPPHELFVVRATSAPAPVIAAIRRAARSVDPDVAVSKVSLVETVLAQSIAGPRFNMVLLTLFAGLALALAAVGLAAVVGYAVAERTHEIGIRMALGAREESVLRQVVMQGLRATLAGLVVGLVGALAATRALATLLYGVEPRDPLTFAAVAALLLAVALVASWLPARRAARVDPIIALRAE
ncbi:MAG TPA: ADOP family duplicated permease [Gemmatimonadaceae bacterium]|nr:ADOP family duplicated permease [Gemmatimonadaceae bacterium]